VARLRLEDEEEPQDPGPARGGRVDRQVMKARRVVPVTAVPHSKGSLKKMAGVVRFLALKKKLGWDKT